MRNINGIWLRHRNWNEKQGWALSVNFFSLITSTHDFWKARKKYKIKYQYQIK